MGLLGKLEDGLMSFGELIPEITSAGMLAFTLPLTEQIYKSGGVPGLAIEAATDLYFSYVLYRGILRGEGFRGHRETETWPDPLKSVYRRIKCKIEGKPYSFE